MAMYRVLVGVLGAFFLAMVVPAGAPLTAAQRGLPCDVETAPDDGLASAALGLTRLELDRLYGPGNAAQSGWVYEFDGFDLMLADCDLILDIDPDGQFADPESAADLVRTLLPEDAVLAGSWQF